MINKTLYWKFSPTLLFFAQFTYATDIYQWQDAQGRRHYSDQNHQNATVFKLIEDLSFYQVKKVYDGDTILLHDGRKVRLLGINTPEIEHPRQIAQAGGDAAKQWLTQQVLNIRIRLEYDLEKRDKYQRHLAHIFTEQGVHINRELVRLGYASINTYPPNLKYLDQLLLAEQEAEVNVIGIWQYPDYQAKPASAINARNKWGWQRITGHVRNIKTTTKNYYLQFTDGFVVRIKKKHSKYFNDLKLLTGKNIEARGWVNKYKSGFSMLVKHPSALKVVE